MFECLISAIIVQIEQIIVDFVFESNYTVITERKGSIHSEV